MRQRVKRITRAAAVVAAGAGIAALGAALPANAATGSFVGQNGYTGMCASEICLYFNSWQHGYGAIWATDYLQVNDLAGQYFSYNAGAANYGGDPSSGAGVSVKNHAANVEDEGSYTDFVYYNSANYGWGNYDYLNPGQSGRLVQTYNNDAAYSVNFNN